MARTKPKIDRLQIVRKRGWLSMTPTAFQDRVLKCCRLQSLQSGDPVFRLDDEHGGIYCLIEGSVAVFAAPTDRGPYLVHIGRPGLWMGAGPLFNYRRRSTVTATRPSVCLQLPQKDIQAIVAEIPEAWRTFGMLAMYTYDVAMSAHDDLMLRDPLKRCLAVLLRLGDCRHPNLSEKEPIELDVRQQDIAVLANLSLNAVGNILRSLEARGVISLEYRVIKILDAKALRKAAKTV